MTSTGSPPSAETRIRPPAATGAKTITPSLLQVPPRPSGALQITSDDPSATAIFLSFPSEKNPRYRLSGDQNGNAALSVPASCCAASELMGRSQMRPVPPVSVAR